jgi:pyruvate,water dikinase
MIVPEISGVAFSVNPVTSDRGQLIIESVLGNCSALVSGEVTPTHHCIEKNSIDPQASPSLIDKVAKITLEIESALGYPVDVEWAATQDTIHILQARRITTLSN